jgi:type II secretory pathway component PulF
MPLYEYKAYDRVGKMSGGLVDAPSIASAHGKLKKQGLFPVDINRETERTHRSSVPSSDLIFALEQVSTLLKAGMPLPEALDTLVGQMSNEELRRSFARVKVHLEEGKSFATALSMEKTFPPVLVKMVEAGETVGAVDKILERFAEFIEKETAFKEKIFSAMMYPATIMTASFGLIFFLLIYIAPTLVKVFTSFNRKLPVPTQVLLGVGTFLKSYAIILIPLFIGGIFVYFKFVPRQFRDNVLLKIPVWGKIHLHTQMSRWARTLAMLHGGGVSLLKALASSREVIDNTVVREHLQLVEDYVQRGEGLGSALARIPSVPQLFIQMTKTSEKSGELERLLNTAASFYEKEVDKKLGFVFKFLEPAVILFLGLVVGFVVVAALLPIFEINKLIR